MMRILIGHDGSQSADAALVDLQRAGLPDEAKALIISVADIIMVPATPAYELAAEALMSRRVTAGLLHAQRYTERVVTEAKEFANRAKEQLRSYFPHWNVRAETLAGSAGSVIISKADEWKPDLIVVGSHGRSAVSRFILGSVSKKVVTDSVHSVRVSRGDRERDLSEPLKLVIGVDASDEAEQAVRAVGSRVWPNGTEVQIITVDDGRSPMFTRTAGRMVAWADNALSLIGLKTSVVWEKGDPRRVLIDRAQAWDADSIFVGGRRFSSVIERFQLGSVATALVTKADCSVEVVRNQAS